MVDGIVDIPLSGQMHGSDGEGASTATSGHFLVGPENRLVEVAVRSVMDDTPDRRLDSPPEAFVYNPLVVYGPSGTGKSHLAGGLAAAWKARNRRQRVVLTTAVDFARELAEAIESQAVEEFRTKYRTANLLVFEDLGMLATRKSGKLSAQEELIHTLDALLAMDRWVIVTASAAPVELLDLLPALRSRLAAGLTIPLALPGPEARLAILRQLAAIRNIQLPEPIAQLLAEGLAGVAPELAGALMQLAASDRLDDKPIDMHAAKQYLAERNRQPQPSLHEIALATARHFSLKLSDLRSPLRQRMLVTARGVAIYLARHFGGSSFQQIGCYFGGRDHTTMMHSCRKIDELSKGDVTIHEAIERLHQQLWKN